MLVLDFDYTVNTGSPTAGLSEVRSYTDILLSQSFFSVYLVKEGAIKHHDGLNEPTPATGNI